MASPTPPAHLPGAQKQYLMKRGMTRRLHNRRISMVVTPEGAYQLHIAVVLALGDAAELRRAGHHDSAKDYILRDRVRYFRVTLTAEAWEAAFWCYEALKGKRQRA